MTRYELICSCGDHIKIIPAKDEASKFIGYCMGCDQGFIIMLKTLSTNTEIYYHEEVVKEKRDEKN